MGSTAKGLSGTVLEAGQSGVQLLLAPTAISALPASLTTPIPGSAVTGMRLLVLIYNHSTTGTLSFAGTAPLSGAAVNETSTTIQVAEVPGEFAKYTTTNVFASINASGITLGGGLTNGTIVIYGIQAAKRQLVGETKIHRKAKEYSPLDQRGSFDRDWHLLALADDATWEWQADFYPDDALHMLYGGYNSTPTVASIPAAPISLLAATSVTSGGNASLTTQPSAPGMVLIATLVTTPTTAGTVTINGINEYGEADTEVLVPSTKVATTYYGSKRWQSVNANGVVWTAFGTGVTVAITGVFGWQFTGLPGDTLASQAIEQWDTTGSYTTPFGLINEWSLEGAMDSETKVMCQGPAQGVFVVGDSTNPANQITVFSQPQDMPISGWETQCFIDPNNNAFGTTLQGDLIKWKVTFKTPWVPKYTSWGNPPYRTWKVAYRNRREVEVELLLDMTNNTFNTEYQAFEQRRTRFVRIVTRGPLLGVSAGTAYYLGLTIDLPLKWNDEPAREYTTGKESVEVTLKGKAKFDMAQGFSHRLIWNARFPAW